MSARIRVRAGLSGAAGSDVKDDILNVKGAKMPFVGAVRIVCERKGVEHDIIEHAMAWVGCRNSYSAVPLGKGLFLVSGDLAEAEVRDLQLMAVAPGPSPEQLARMGAPPNSKDIHVGTGRVPLRAFLEASCGSAGSADENQPRGALMSIGYDPVQPDVELKVQAVPLPEGMRGRFREMNRAALRALSAMEETLIPMGQDRIHRYNMRQNLISQRFSAELLQRGIKRHPEGVMTGSFVSSIGNTLVDLLTNMDVIMQEKIRLSRTTALDAFGITSSLFRMTGLSFHDRIDARAAADCLANVGGLFASDFTYASDVKPLLAEKTPRDLKPIIERQEGDGYVIEVYEDSEDQEKAPAYAMSEDIMVPFSDIYLRSARVGDAFKGASIGASVKGDTPGESLFNHLDKKRRGYVEGLRRGDCEDLAHMAILQFSYMRRFCVRLSSKCGVIYDEHPDLERMEPAKFAGVVLQSLRAQPELKEWTDDELRGVLRQCGEFGEHIHGTSMRAVLMTAMAAKMSATGKPGDEHAPRGTLRGHDCPWEVERWGCSGDPGQSRRVVLCRERPEQLRPHPDGADDGGEDREFRGAGRGGWAAERLRLAEDPGCGGPAHPADGGGLLQPVHDAHGAVAGDEALDAHREARRYLLARGVDDRGYDPREELRGGRPDLRCGEHLRLLPARDQDRFHGGGEEGDAPDGALRPAPDREQHRPDWEEARPPAGTLPLRPRHHPHQLRPCSQQGRRGRLLGGAEHGAALPGDAGREDHRRPPDEQVRDEGAARESDEEGQG